MKKYEVAAFLKPEPESETGQWETMLETDSYEEAESAFLEAIHEGMLGPNDTGYTDRSSLYGMMPDGTQEPIEERYA